MNLHLTNPQLTNLHATEILDQARLIADPEEVSDVDRALARVANCRLRVLVLGEAKRGKSTLINALLGRPLLPTGVVPVTAVTTTITVGDRLTEAAIVTGLDGIHESIDLDRLAHFVTESGNPGNNRGVAEVTVRVSSPIVRSFRSTWSTPPGSVPSTDTTPTPRTEPCLPWMPRSSCWASTRR